VPSGLDVTFDPLLDSEEIFLVVLNVILDTLVVGVDVVSLRSATGQSLSGPAAVLNVGRDGVGTSVGIGGLNV
jgi:hypothetical protein